MASSTSSASSTDAPPESRAFADSGALTNVITPRRSVRQHVVQVWAYRELLAGLVRKELKIKYKNSALGFLWSMLNPAMYLVIFYVVFQLVLKAGIPMFAIFLLSGLLVWNLFSAALSSSVGSITNNASLVNKVYFPRTILPLAAVGASLVHFFIQGGVLLAVLLAFRSPIGWAYLPLVPVALLVLLLLTAACAIFLAALNVYARDSQHLLELALLAWFWLTPIVYQYQLVGDRLAASSHLPSWLALANPITPIVLVFQRAFYARVDGGGAGDRAGGIGSFGILPDASVLWYGRNLAIVGLLAVVLLALAIRFFGRVEGNFAEEL